ncbi:MAG TPA: hypothetical protein P5055_00535 [Candidatus Paceibacterota bacterium]|nr:hypothetical protein [Verrucomicrobiota bacterium]HRZ99195.1 hypothetical protein [Candidatus Paceibacterota bacterium]
MRRMIQIQLILGFLALASSGFAAATPWLTLNPENFRHHIESFNRNDIEQKVNLVDNKAAWTWMEKNIPLFECSDKLLEEIYYFRWWTYRKHIKQTPDGYVMTEFLPDVPWGGKYNTISCAAGHHFYEGRWLRDRRYLRDYAYFWFRKGGEPRRYSFWAADALRAWAMVTQDQQVCLDLLPDLISNYQGWEKSRQDPNGLFWQEDGQDGMEVSIGGSGYRSTINSYMYGDAVAIGDIAKWAGKPEQSMEFRLKAAKLREWVEDTLWDETADFYKVLPRGADQPLADVRELHGYVPWYFNLPHPGREVAWAQLMNTNGFYAPYGPTTAERRHPRFRFEHSHDCLWNGPSWPYATAQTLTAMANLLNHYKQDYVGKRDYLELLRIYARTHYLKISNGRLVPWIDENYDPITGETAARTVLYGRTNESNKDRGRDYNHSTFNDLIITGLVGLRPRLDQWLEINPLVPEGALDYFCLDGVRYHDFNLTLLYDRTGQRYDKGPGLHLYANGQELCSSPRLEWLRTKLPQTTAGWKKFEGNPVIGGNKPMAGIGTVFDIAVLREDATYRMWGSWRPKRSVALFESQDGIHWSPPQIVFPPEPASGWEDDINRPTVLKRSDGYHMWYTGQTKDRSSIGYATSADGKKWNRMSAKPVLSPEQPWEKGALMCPHVLWDDEARLFRMWYSGGGQYEPDAMGYATSPDGLHWTRHASNPVFGPDRANVWEQERVTACQVFRRGEWHVMVYIGFRDIDHAQIGIARSRDGVTAWERHPANPMIRPGQDSFDQEACYKPFVVFDGKKWLLWYNGRHGRLEQIALVFHEGDPFDFGSTD